MYRFVLPVLLPLLLGGCGLLEKEESPLRTGVIEDPTQSRLHRLIFGTNYIPNTPDNLYRYQNQRETALGVGGENP